jgi:hypothetical protein
VTGPRRDGLPKPSVWYSLLAVLVASLLTAATSIVVSVQLAKRNARDNEQKWCAVISALDEGYSSNPQSPTTPRGRKLREDFHQLRQDLGC